MSVVGEVARFCESLLANGIRYHMDIAREEAILIRVAVPGERWEIEFLKTGAIEIERFVTQGVEECSGPLDLLLERYR